MKRRTLAFGGLLMAVAVTGYSVSGTYAKYTSKIDLTDEARVAKWDFYARDGGNCTKVEGVYNEQTGQMDGVRWECAEATKLNLFSDSYTYNNDTKLYVKSFDGDKVVAPGTKGDFALRFGGAMEVRHDFKLAFKADREVAVYYKLNGDKLEIKEFKTADEETTLIAGGYTKYSPMTYTFHMYEDGFDKTISGSLDEIKTKLNEWNESTENDFAPGRLGMAIDISWKWDAITQGTGLTDDQVNELDTHIGKNWATWYPDAGNDLGSAANYTLTASATQIAENHSVKAN